MILQLLTSAILVLLVLLVGTLAERMGYKSPNWRAVRRAFRLAWLLVLIASLGRLLRRLVGWLATGGELERHAALLWPTMDLLMIAGALMFALGLWRFLQRLRWQEEEQATLAHARAEAEAQLHASESERSLQAEQLRSYTLLLTKMSEVVGASAEGQAVGASLQSVLEGARQVTASTHASILLLDEAGALWKSILFRRDDPAGGEDLGERMLTEGLAAWVRRHRQPTRIDNVAEDDRWIALPDAPYSVASVLSVPLLHGSLLLGILTLGHPTPAHYQEEQEALLLATASQMALLLYNARLTDAMQQRTHAQQLLHSLGQAARGQRSRAGVAAPSVAQLARGPLGPDVAIALLDNGRFRIAATAGSAPRLGSPLTAAASVLPLECDEATVGLLWLAAEASARAPLLLKEVCTLLGAELYTALLYESSQQQIAARREVEAMLREAGAVLEQRVAERTAALQEEQRFVSAVLETVEALVVVLDRAGRIIRFNRAAEQLTRFSAAEVLGLPFWDLFVPQEEVEPQKQRFKRLIHETLFSNDQSSWLIRSGERRQIAWANTTLWDERGVLYVVATGVDVTEQRRSEERLRASEARTRAVLLASPAWIVVLNDGGQVRLTNRFAASGWHGLALPSVGSDYLDGSWFPLAQADPDEAAALRTAIHDTLSGGPSQTLALTCQGSDGRPRWLLVEVAPLELAGEGIAVAHMDVTEQRLAQQQLARTERLAALGRLAAAIAHEINNPLQTMRSHMDLALDFPLEEAERAASLTLVRQEIERLSEGTARVLNFARLRNQPRQRTEIGPLIEQAVRLAAKRLSEANLRLERTLKATEALWIAPDEFVQVCLNLLLNAADATPPGGWLRIATWQDAAWLHVEIANQGEPIPQPLLGQIFEPFFTTKGEGTGLGLAVSQNLIAAQGGTLRARNLPDSSGVAFTISLPVDAAD